MKTVAIMLCTYNGARFLDAQLKSLAEQTVTDLVVFVSDDGSTDATLEVIERNKKQFPHLNIQALESSLRDPRKGFQYNFLSVFKLQSSPARYVAYADQDDIWEKDKLERALNFLETCPADQPALYGCRTRLIDENDLEIGYSKLFTKKPIFANALTQSILGGNTMVMNTAAWTLMKVALDPDIVSHDWWTYLVISGAGGRVFYDSYPSLRYRQHVNNLIGANKGFKGCCLRAKQLLQGRLRDFNHLNLAALLTVKPLLTSDNQRLLNHYVQARQAGLMQRLRYLLRFEIYRQTFFENVGLCIAILFRKI